MGCCNHDHGCATNTAPVSAAAASAATLPAGTEKAVLLIQKMDCPTEEKLIRDRFQKMEGVLAMQFNLMARELTVHHTLPSLQGIVTALKKLDLEPVVKSDSLDADAEHAAKVTLDGSLHISQRKWLLMGLSGVTAIGSEVVAWTTGSDSSMLVIALALTAILTGGLDTLRKGWVALRHFSLNMNFLMSLAVIGAVLIGQWPEAAVVIFLFAAAEMIEAMSLDRARNAIQSLMAMTPDMATVRDAGGEWQAVPAASVDRDAVVRMRPGERLPLDGIIEEGQSAINQAPITGESLPVERGPGDQVFAGTINEHGTFTYRVTAAQTDSTLARIIRSVQEVQGERAPTQRFVDQFARYYIPAVVALALLIAIVPPLVTGAAFQPWLYKALVLLVIACPCALVISTPVTVVSGLAAAARHGILIKGGVYLEMGRKLKAIALDKTGTITAGKPAVVDVVALGGDADNLLQIAASLGHLSDHPVSTAVFAAWKRHTQASPFEVSDFSALTGRGVKGVIDGQTWYLGNHRLIHEMGVCSPELEAVLDGHERAGKTVVVLASETRRMLLITVADTVRADAADAITRLQRQGVHVVMLTGDNPHTAEAIAAQVGIADARGNMLPEDKLAAVSALQTERGKVGMVGDGINDAPALAKADIGFAMGAAGTDTALETADVALMDDRLGKLADFIGLSRSTHRVLLQNIMIALGIKAVFLVLALTGEATLWMAVFADMGASLIVVANGLRLLRAIPNKS
ncbi:heavy metal translocating P-type ATPase [uncultured Oxalicibacterium sp.]|uniref:heavy metal translocating P-type ATPase n=1 Tax=uncultured Oxalicibacterium sp. TaxID=1168540 RepID=UPI0025E1D436|nr:heavy metal translocating P-type ATPase [uncultured Oxalicibacterium sp.]